MTYRRSPAPRPRQPGQAMANPPSELTQNTGSELLEGGGLVAVPDLGRAQSSLPVSCVRSVDLHPENGWYQRVLE